MRTLQQHLLIVGIVTGVGLVHGREVLFVANDATVKGRLFVNTYHKSFC